MKCKYLLLLLAILISIVPATAKIQPDIPDAATLQLLMKRLSVVGSALYIAAHPDDENTAVLSTLALGRLVRTAYLAVNRGEGGQNLIGPEQGELLGVIRTQELLAARSLDTAGQFFTRAIDFGFSKTPEESIRIWGKEEVLSDMVWVIRKFQPDVIILRFTSAGGGHGHHTASAILGEEAFYAAADPAKFPNQLRYVTPWKAKRIVWNRYNWRGNEPSDAEKSSLIKLQVGDYNTLLGKSYSELAGISRSMHKSQGFGDSEDRGQITNYFEVVAGDPASNDFFEGVDLSWNRIPGSRDLKEVINQAITEFKPSDPSASIPKLIKAYTLIKKLKQDPLVVAKKEELAEVIRYCSGLWLEAISDDNSAVPGQNVQITVSALNRSSHSFSLESINLSKDVSIQKQLPFNQAVSQKLDLNIPSNATYSQPYWLKEKAGKALAKVDDQQLIGRADSPPPYQAIFRIAIGGEVIEYSVPVLYRWVDPVEGERYRMFQIIPEVSIQLHQRVAVFSNGAPNQISMTLQAGIPNSSGTLKLNMPAGFKSDPESIQFQFAKKGDTADFKFHVTTINSAQSGDARAEVTLNEKTLSSGLTVIDYPHIPPQRVFPVARIKFVHLDLKRNGDSIGYVMGSGDQVPESLEEAGYKVTLLSDEQLNSGDYSGFDAIVVGIRAYNTRRALASAHQALLKYAEGGGTLVIQYNTLDELMLQSPGPYPFQIGRDRVSVEDAPVTILDPAHPVLNIPNKITSADFEGWIQERGLYFPGQWDPKYQTPIASSDPGETAKAGGILYAKYGKGIFIYTSYSWFRELPAGVPGAYRLFVNLVSAHQ
jgi:LmbE family N-acetylglucosaminyl deacetylase